jgi:D-alanyl-D-alanine carboxypeptidase/D-alanyl-D-alanine-endopeptidase (penicillin-binding protein 4)
MTLYLTLGCLFLGQAFGPAPDDVDSYVQRLQEDTPLLADRIAIVARDSLGLTYADGPLGEGPDGAHDTDPLIDLTRVDCVTYVEQTLALACAANYQDAFDRLQRIRYRDGKVDYETRNHFMVADWLEENRFCRDVSTELGVSTESLTRTISRRDFFQLVKAPEVGQDTPDREVTINYIPSAQAEAAAAKLPSPSLIVFIGNVDWLFALHCGIFIRDADGTGKLYHASSKAGEVVAVDLAEYVAENGSRYKGFTAYELTDDLEAATK